MLEVKKLVKRYGSKLAVSDVSFKVENRNATFFRIGRAFKSSSPQCDYSFVKY